MKVAERLDLESSHHRKESVIMWGDGGVLSNATVVIISQYNSVSKQHIAHLKLSQCYVLIISVCKVAKN